jgi:hypothetical protein
MNKRLQSRIRLSHKRQPTKDTVILMLLNGDLTDGSRKTQNYASTTSAVKAAWNERR